MNNYNDKRVELLAPAGGMEQLKAAVQNGADAVYLGGKLFNARINASNFTNKELREAVVYAHLREVKVYVTLNILIKDEELEPALKYVAKLYEIGIDAIIVQDLGLASLVKKYIPNMPMHLSTQGTVYNPSGVRFAKEMGFDRVVLARELSIEEIKQTTDICEIEVFVHGALCMCYSGQCQLSRYLGGRSGNRGECAQPCRLLYTNEKGEKGYFLSPKDFCAIERLPEIIEAGVTSLKIEGRMKSASYVAEVVRIYRKYIDLYYNKKAYKVDEKDLQELRQVFSRGEFTQGYLDGEPKEPYRSVELSKHQGTYIGKVVDNQGGNSQLIHIKVEKGKELKLGDGIEIRSKKLTGNIVTYIEKVKDSILCIGDIKDGVRNGDLVYKISSKEQKQKAEKTTEANNKKLKINMVFTAITDQKPELVIWKDNIEVVIKENDLLQKAQNKPIDEDMVSKQLKKTGSTSFVVDDLSIFVDGQCTMPLSLLNKMRREGLEKIATIIGQKREVVLLPKIEYNKLQVKHKELDYPQYPNVTKGQCDSYIEKNIKGDGVVLNNIGWIREFQRQGIKVYGGSGLNVYNSATKEFFEGNGVEIIDSSLEYQLKFQDLMTIEYKINTEKLINKKGDEFGLISTDYSDKKKLIVVK